MPMAGPTTMAQAWAAYLERIVPSTASESQVKETKRTFYAAFYKALEMQMCDGAAVVWRE